MSFDKIFSMMYRLNEGRFGVEGGNRFSAGNSDRKIVAVAKTDFTFRIKLVGDWADYIVSSRLTKAGYDGIINWINTQAPKEFLKKYEDVNLKDKYFLVYEILKDREDALIGADKQVFEFTITERSTVRNLSKDVNHVTMEELDLIRSGGDPIQGKAELNAGTSGNTGTSSTSGVAGNTGSLTDAQIKAKGGNPITLAAAAIKGNADPKVISFLTSAYKLIKTDPAAGAHPGLVKARAEIKAQKLDAAAQAFVYALNSGFGVKDSLGDETEDGITNKLISKVWTNPIPESRGYFLHPNGYSLIKEEASTIIGFDADAFTAGFNIALTAAQTKTGDIVVPPEGFKFDTGVTKNPELAKFQTILKTNLPTYMGGALAKVPVVAAFIKATADGGYGTRTQALVAYLKDGLSDPKYPDNDKTTIKPDFVRRMLIEFKLIKESNSYRGLGSRGVISEGFDTGAAADSGGSTPKVYTPKVDKDGKPVVYVKKEKAPAKSKLFDGSEVSRALSNNPTFEFKNSTTGIWYCKEKTEGESAWRLASNGSVKLLQTQYKADGGYWNLGTDTGYDLNKTNNWVLSKDPSILADDATILKLNAAYPGAGQTQSQVTAGLSVAQIDALHIKVAKQIKTWIDTPVNLDPYKGWQGVGNDNEVGAWSAVVTAMTTGTGENTVNGQLIKADKAIALTTSAEKTRLVSNQANLRNMFNGKNNTMKNKFMGDTADDVYVIRLGKSDGSVFTLGINTDF